MTIDLQPLGDQAALARLANESAALAFAAAVRRLKLPWVVDVVQAYTTVAVFHDRDRISLTEVLDELAHLRWDETAANEGRLVEIPCCYSLALDFQRIADHTGLDSEAIIRLHSAMEYTVYAIGFCPGFPYLGYLPGELAGVPRLESPRLRVEAGSVGLTGRQTGIYTEVRPGGWNIVGRTPLVLVDVADGYFPLRTGDRVRFVPVEEGEFARLAGRRL